MSGRNGYNRSVVVGQITYMEEKETQRGGLLKITVEVPSGEYLDIVNAVAFNDTGLDILEEYREGDWVELHGKIGGNPPRDADSRVFNELVVFNAFHVAERRGESRRNDDRGGSGGRGGGRGAPRDERPPQRGGGEGGGVDRGGRQYDNGGGRSDTRRFDDRRGGAAPDERTGERGGGGGRESEGGGGRQQQAPPQQQRSAPPPQEPPPPPPESSVNEPGEDDIPF